MIVAVKKINFFAIFKVAGFLTLLVGAGLFVKENWDAYQSKQTSIIFSKEVVETFVNPTIAYCFNPMTKGSVMAKYHVKEGDFINADVGNDTVSNTNFSMPWPNIYHKSSFRLGKDFIFKIQFNQDEADRTFMVNERSSALADIEEVYTLWSGLCTKLKLKSKLFPLIGNRISLVFNESLPEEDIPEVSMHISSEENASNTNSNSKQLLIYFYLGYFIYSYL